ncbi:MAG: aldolase/citrate lyase family protein [Thermomicrobiales bacterium]|nr:aldolase/citrate lyase family protein [Thermomicrobiales bacterium]
MATNTLKQKLAAGNWVSGPIVEEIRTVGGVKMLALAGHDFLWWDMEHNFYDWDSLLHMVQFTHLFGMTPLVRVTDLSYANVARALDTGAQGIVIPRVDNADQAEQAVSYAKYPPRGRRGAGGMARNNYESKTPLESVEEGNAETMVVLQIEHPDAIEELDAICQVDGVDVICVGPQDLSVNMGIHGQFGSQEFQAAIGRINEICAKYDKPVGMVSRDAASFKTWNDLGCRFLVCNSDLSLIFQQASRDRQTLEEVIG